LNTRPHPSKDAGGFLRAPFTAFWGEIWPAIAGVLLQVFTSFGKLIGRDLCPDIA